MLCPAMMLGSPLCHLPERAAVVRARLQPCRRGTVELSRRGPAGSSEDAPPRSQCNCPSANLPRSSLGRGVALLRPAMMLGNLVAICLSVPSSGHGFSRAVVVGSDRAALAAEGRVNASVHFLPVLECAKWSKPGRELWAAPFRATSANFPGALREWRETAAAQTLLPWQVMIECQPSVALPYGRLLPSTAGR